MTPDLSPLSLQKPEAKFNPAYVGKRDDVLTLVGPDVKKVLDVGCSNGRLGADLKLRAPQAVAVGA